MGQFTNGSDALDDHRMFPIVSSDEIQKADFTAATRCDYDLLKYFSCRIIVNIWNSLSSEVVNTSSLNSFKNRLDRFWMNQDILYNWHAELTGTSSRSIVLCYP